MNTKVSSAPSPRRSVCAASEPQLEALNAVWSHVQPTSKEDDADLLYSLKRYGQLAPILRRGGQIVDGRRRIAAANELAIEPWIVDLPSDNASPTTNDLLGRTFFEVNARRRELTVAVRAAIADSLATMRKGDNQHSGAVGLSREDAARAAGVSADSLDRYRKIKNDAAVHTKVLKGEMTLPQAVRTVESRAIAEKAKAYVSEKDDAHLCVEQLANDAMTFNFFYGDPPWDYGLGDCVPTHSANPALHYPTMTLEAIKALPVAKLAAKDAVLWLWTPNCLLEDALEVVKAWGFHYVTTAVWVKDRGVPSPGSIRPTHETLITAKRGSGLAFQGPPMSSVFAGAVAGRVHSRKPYHFAAEAERLFPDAAKVELFCRQPRQGWVTLGNQMGRLVPASGKAANESVQAPRTAKAASHATAVSKKKTAKKTPKTARKGRS
jgi:N6-adenosine-specific RNA methylase IME4